MQVGSPPFGTYPALPEPDSATVGQRKKRSLDSSPSKEQALVQGVAPAPGSSVTSDPDKGVGAGEKVPVPVDLGPNINVEPVTQKVSGAFKTVKEEASIFLKNTFAKMAAQATTPAEKEKWNIDPDNTYLVTYDYNSTGERPYSAKIIKRISLTEALITNAQDTPKGTGYQVPFYPGGPEVIVKSELKTHTPGIFNFSSRFNPYTEKAHTTHTYQGIYIESSDGPAPVYNGVNQSSITPHELKKLIWKADYQKPYDQFLNQFWSDHQKNYPLLAKASFVKAAMSQHQEESLSQDARDLVMRAAGLSGSEASWPDITLEDLQKKPPKDPDIDVGMLKVGRFRSTDLMYITDKKVKFDANGKKLPPLTLLYVPGNSSPIHTFNSPSEMKAWFAEQMADPVKREAMATHFPLKDKPDGYARAGIDETLAGLGTWPEKRETPGGLLSYDHRAFNGFWDPQDFIKTEPSHSPFDEITTRQKDRSYSDAVVDITSDRDVTKNGIISGMDKAARAALFLTPLAFVIPEVALALDAFYLASGLTTTGIGIDDKKHGKPTGNLRITFGVFNAALVVLPHALRGGKVGEGAASEVESTQIKPAEEPAPNSIEAEPLKPIEPAKPELNRLPPSKWQDISNYSVPEGEQLISGVTPNTRGIFQVKNPGGEDRWLVRMADDHGESRIYEINDTFKLRDGYAQVVDPVTKKPLMTVHVTGEMTWEPINGPGGIKFPWQSGSSQPQQFDPATYDYPAEGEASSSKANEKIDKQLKQDANNYHKKAKTIPSPVLDDVPRNASPTEVINTVYKKSHGLIIGEDHSQSAGIRFLIDNASDFKKNGVTTLYSEGFEHSLQPDLDRFFETGEFSPALKRNLILIDHAHSGHGAYTNRELLLTMRKHGIRVKAIDVPSVEPIPTRLKNMNYYASKVIERDQAVNPQEKWVARVGNAHVFNYDGTPTIRGLSQLTGATGVSTDDALPNKGMSVIQSRDKTELFIEL
ncbi:membrane-targeted effector domain-containing toxin [Pseudomonas sp.]|uniref:membrane-targeted effector domain-containing toxin n=1 Tax=Pseudomonas sp. TaxID=306 RepID=UPI003263E152